METLASAVGVTKAALYYHFDSKDTLVLAVARRALEQDRRDVQTVIDSAPTPITQLQALLHAFSQASTRPHQHLHLAMRDASRFLPSAHQSELHQRLRAGVPQQLQQLLQSGVEQRQFEPHNTYWMTAVLGTVLGDLAARPPGTVSEEELAQLMNFVMRGLGAHTSAPPSSGSTSLESA